MITADPAEARCFHARAQLALSDAGVLIDCQFERCSRRRRPLNAAERMPACVGLDEDSAGLAANE